MFLREKKKHKKYMKAGNLKSKQMINKTKSIRGSVLYFYYLYLCDDLMELMSSDFCTINEVAEIVSH